ncbi:MAG: hypothetical protein H8D42_04950 [Candidatus Marinimicrobia bacterium]|nr:hypothetical protein [Candidatus Neomarinimicrobiota bacterium]
MKKIILALIFLISVAPGWGKSNFSFLKPDKYGKLIKIQIKGKDRTYYKLDKSHPIEVTVEGPTRLKVCSRLDMQDYKKDQKVDYKIFCKIDNDDTHYTRSAVHSPGIKFSKSNNGQIGGSEVFTLDIAPGKHKIKLFFDKKNKQIAYIRLLKEGNKSTSSVERVAMHPQKFTKQVKILVKENEYDYYRIGSADSLSLKLIGPCTLKVLSRLEYNVTMNGGKKYRIAVYEDGKLKNTFLKSTKLSESAVYADKKSDLQLSQGDDFYVEVPEGEHIYTFQVKDDGRNLLFKFYLPVDDLNNTIR